ncbi:MAG: Hydrolase TatD family [Anaerolineaceae bacterium]|nr:MAG: Hydrolase TatD family [Anaerolineaceae bacterium]
MLTDTHCHLDYDKFDADREAVLERARQASVTRILIPGTTWTSSLSAVKLAESHPMLVAAVGVHPTDVDTFQVDTLAGLRKLAASPKVVAIGEIGLDYYWDTAPHDLQQRVLKEQLNLAAELELPVILHFREKGDAPDGPCAADLMKMLEEWVAGLRSRKSPLAERPGALHSFAGSRATASRAIGLNFYIGVTGPVTYRKERQELIASLPLERLLIETDAPFLAPAPQRGKRNEPAFVALIADKISKLHNCSTEETAAATANNAARLFAWD